jgi:hypothetical protein
MFLYLPRRPPGTGVSTSKRSIELHLSFSYYKEFVKKLTKNVKQRKMISFKPQPPPSGTIRSFQEGPDNPLDFDECPSDEKFGVC